MKIEDRLGNSLTVINYEVKRLLAFTDTLREAYMETIAYKARRLIEKHEGMRLKPYRCTAGRLTIGIGRNLDDTGITSDEAYLLLENDINRVTWQLEQNISCWADLSDARKIVLIDMCINLGLAGLLKFKNMLQALAERDFDLAAAEMLDSMWARQVGQRAQELSEIMKNNTL